MAVWLNFFWHSFRDGSIRVSQFEASSWGSHTGNSPPKTSKELDQTWYFRCGQQSCTPRRIGESMPRCYKWHDVLVLKVLKTWPISNPMILMLKPLERKVETLFPYVIPYCETSPTQIDIWEFAPSHRCRFPDNFFTPLRPCEVCLVIWWFCWGKKPLDLEN